MNIHINSKKKFCHIGFPNNGEVSVLRGLAHLYGLEYHFVHTAEDTFRSAAHVLESSLVCIWNGKQLGSSLMSTLCESRGIPKFHLEWGMLPQSHTYFVDPEGFCGDSILNYNLEWVTSEDIEEYKQLQSKLQSNYSLGNEGYILIPLQRTTDSQILYYTKYNSMQEFVAEIEYMYPNNKILIKPHPKEPQINISTKHDIANPKDDFLELASKASLVVGLTSTSLYEAAILGKPVVSIGDHPLRNNLLSKRDQLLAGITVLRTKRTPDSIKSVLDRFNIEPKY